MCKLHFGKAGRKQEFERDKGHVQASQWEEAISCGPCKLKNQKLHVLLTNSILRPTSTVDKSGEDELGILMSLC